MKTVKLAVDVMGGDHGISVVLPACIIAIKKFPFLHISLVGDKTQIEAFLIQQGYIKHKQLTIVHATEVVGMDELPSHALRSKKDSSMRVSINLVKENKADACVSAGNTGALMAIARFVLKTLPGIDRPAIIASMPTIEGKTRVIDLGANVDSCAEHLFQFAVMGAALIQSIDKKPNPKIALLNIGVEEIKGNDQVKRTAHMLSQCEVLNYVGYVEGDQLFSGSVDLVVCDGFVGNVALKSSEGLAKLMLQVMKESFTRNWLTKIIAFLSMPSLKYMKNKLDPAKYNGATLIGLNGIVIKSHGGASSHAFLNAIEEAIAEVQSQSITRVRDKINSFIEKGVML